MDEGRLKRRSTTSFTLNLQQNEDFQKTEPELLSVNQGATSEPPLGHTADIPHNKIKKKKKKKKKKKAEEAEDVELQGYVSLMPSNTVNVSN